MFGKKKKSSAWKEGFGFGLSSAHVIFFPLFDSGGLLRGRMSGFCDSESSGGARACKSSSCQKVSPAPAVMVTVLVPESEVCLTSTCRVLTCISHCCCSGDRLGWESGERTLSERV